MGESKRRKALGTPSRLRTYQEFKESESYRGHVLMKYKVVLAGVAFWRVEVVALGLPKSMPMAFAQERADAFSLAEVTQTAKKIVGEMIFFGTDVPATSVPEKYLVTNKDPFDALVLKSSTGKRAVCDRHWEEVKLRSKAGAVNAVVFAMKLTQLFVAKVETTGILTQSGGHDKGYTVNLLLDSYAPVCCWLGSDVFARLLAESNPTVLLERAKRAGLQ